MIESKISVQDKVTCSVSPRNIISVSLSALDRVTSALNIITIENIAVIEYDYFLLSDGSYFELSDGSLLTWK